MQKDRERILKKLQDGLRLSNILLPSIAQEKLVDYLDLLVEWNSVHNLSGIKDPEEMISRHILDSLSLLSYLRPERAINPENGVSSEHGASSEYAINSEQGLNIEHTVSSEHTLSLKNHAQREESLFVQRILDVGTGAGLPGIPLALACPDLSFVLLDSNQKKINFVQHAIISLKLKNANTYCGRVEMYQPTALFDLVISRAFASVQNFVLLTTHLLAKNGRFLAMKGKKTTLVSEFSALPTGYSIEKVVELEVLDLNEERSLVWIKKDS